MARSARNHASGKANDSIIKAPNKGKNITKSRQAKRKITNPDSESNETSQKKQKINSLTSSQQEIANTICSFNLALNELFHLKEFQSLVYWRPAEFCRLTNTVPEIYEYFVREPKYQIEWDIFDKRDLSNFPLRLQKKILEEKAMKIKEKFPFKDEVINESNKMETEIVKIISTDLSATGSNVEQQKFHKRGLSKKSKVLETNQKSLNNTLEDPDISESKTESPIIPEFDQNDSKYKIKLVKFSIPPALITHPSHIPSWIPDSKPMHDTKESDNNAALEYNPEKLEIITTSKGTTTSPDVTARLHDLLSNRLKYPIVDENSQEFVNSVEEFNEITKQQSITMKSLYQQIFETKRLELHGDKIERRKTMLSNASSARNNTDPFRSNGMIVPKGNSASATSSTHMDYLLFQAVSFSKLHQSVRKQHLLRARKVATIIEQHFKRKRGEKERLAREREQNLRRVSRLAIQAVKRRWGQALKVYNYLQLQRDEELKKKKGREHLNQMLEHSTQLLEAQFNKSKSNTAEPEYLVTQEESTSSNNDDYFDSDSDDESTDGSEHGSLIADNTNDLSLSVLELKEKYADLDKPLETEDISSSNSSVAELADLLENKQTEIQTPIDQQKILEYTEAEKKMIEQAKMSNNPILDSDSFSDSDLDSESSSTSTISEDEENSLVSSEKSSSLISRPTKNSNYKSELSKLLGTLENNEDDQDGIDTKSAFSEDSDYVKNGNQGAPDETGKESEGEEINGSKVVDVPVPELLIGTLRPYQKQGLNWLASLYNNNTNGILADEMGLGKTIQTISLLAYLACEHHVWGPHLIVVPTSVMLNWEMEFKKFAPGFKVLTYYGSPQQRAQKRKGWNKPDAFHVCITSYQLVVQDQQSFKRRRWKYMILDEAHNIKNFRSTRWKALLNFNTENRLLLTGTPLQNNLMELWSLLYFLMPSSKANQAMPDGFANLEDFQTWFGRPVDKILEITAYDSSDVVQEKETLNRMDLETRNTVSRLHQVLRPYILRRLKKDVEKQMPGKYEHIVYCRLSKRQRFLYDEFMSRAQTKETLASGNYLSIINCLMQLRKVCNHPDLFEVRPIVTSFVLQTSVIEDYSSSLSLVERLSKAALSSKDDTFKTLNLNIVAQETKDLFVAQSRKKLRTVDPFQKMISKLNLLISNAQESEISSEDNILGYYKKLGVEDQKILMDKLKHVVYLNELRCDYVPSFGASFIMMLRSICKIHRPCTNFNKEAILSISERAFQCSSIIETFGVITPAALALDMKNQMIPISTRRKIQTDVSRQIISNPFHNAQVKLSIAFPDKSLLQYDCGKLQSLTKLLRELTSKGHRALIFTQMTKVLDILEQFLNIHGYRYMRLDGATKIEDRQLLTERFNRDPKIPVFILSTRSGGLGINLTGADTVIFYDSDWNPAMDKQCQDRCHRIGQIRDVHIYRFVSEHTIESNILKKANQKRHLDNVVIQEGDFTTDYLGKFSIRDIVDDVNATDEIIEKPSEPDSNFQSMLAQAEDEDDRNAASSALKEVAADDEDFAEDTKPTDVGSSNVQSTPVLDDETISSSLTNNLEDDDYKKVGHIDEYMLRFISNGYYGD